MKVHFENVGYGNACWTAECDEKNFGYDWLYKQVSPKCSSRWIEFYLDEDDENKGYIIAGFRKIGEFKIER